MAKSLSIKSRTNIKLSLMYRIILAVVALIIAYLIVKFGMSTYEGFTTPSNVPASTTTVNFYSMVGCGHCEKFQPEWDTLNKKHPSGTALPDGTVLSLNTYSTGDAAGSAKITADNITGFPTITITSPNTDPSTKSTKPITTVTYTGPRTEDALWKFITKQGFGDK